MCETRFLLCAFGFNDELKFVSFFIIDSNLPPFLVAKLILTGSKPLTY